MGSRNYKVLGIGTPVVDYLLHVTHDAIEALPGARGGTSLIENELLQTLLQDKGGHNLAFIPGGSAANTIKGLANLGHTCALLGRIGDDPAGRHFQQALEASAITPLLLRSEQPTAQAACLISPDSERTMYTSLGAGKELKPSDLTPHLFKGVKLVHIEGYLLAHENLVQRAMELAKEAGAQVSFDLSSFEIAAQYKQHLLELLSTYVNIVFANEEETKALTGLTPEEGCMLLKSLSDTAVVKMGAEGCWAAQGQHKIFYPAIPVKTVDTTGAGDLFASGFLHGHLSGQPLVEQARLGTLVASNVVQILGTDISAASWHLIRSSLSR